MTQSDETRAITRMVGLGCPACGGTLRLREGITVEQCPFCNTWLLLNVPGNVPRYSAVRQLDESDARRVVRRWLRSQLLWPFRWARVQNALLVYAPFWLATGRTVGLFFNGKRGWIDRRVSWAQPAYDVSELSVKDIWLAGDELVPLDRDALMRDGMVLKANVPQAEGWRQAVERLLHAARTTSSSSRQSRVDLVERRQALLYYPMWLIRFRYWGRYYRAVVDGTEPRLLAGQVSDRLPKLIILISLLGLLGSFFSVWGFVVAAILAAILSPRLAGVESPEDRIISQLPRARKVDPLWRHTLRDDVEQETTGEARLIPLHCPTCDRSLSGEGDAALFYCVKCRQGVEYREGELRSVEVTFVKAQAGGHVPHPWWVLTVRSWHRGAKWSSHPDEKTLNIYVPAYSLPFPECITQGVYLTRHQPKLQDTEAGKWRTCTVSRTDAMRLAELIYLSLDDDPERIERQLELASMRLIVFLSK